MSRSHLFFLLSILYTFIFIYIYIYFKRGMARAPHRLSYGDRSTPNTTPFETERIRPQRLPPPHRLLVDSKTPRRHFDSKSARSLSTFFFFFFIFSPLFSSPSYYISKINKLYFFQVLTSCWHDDFFKSPIGDSRWLIIINSHNLHLHSTYKIRQILVDPPFLHCIYWWYKALHNIWKSFESKRLVLSRNLQFIHKRNTQVTILKTTQEASSHKKKII